MSLNLEVVDIGHFLRIGQTTSAERPLAMARKKRACGPAGDTLESFLEERGLRDKVYEHAIKAVLAWQLGAEMKRQKLSKTALAAKLGTSRTEIYRVLDPENDAVSLGTLKRAAAALGLRLKLDLVDAA
jgi:antitoxin HicB